MKAGRPILATSGSADRAMTPALNTIIRLEAHLARRGTAPCSRGSGVEKGLQPDTIKVYRAVCAKFPQISSYGGRAARANTSGHPTGRALDIMTSDKALGDEIAQFVIDNREKLGMTQVIWRQRIWEPGSGWRGMSDRGGATANHFDHVHVTTSGDAAIS